MKKESFIYSTLTIGGSKEQVNEVMKYICDDIYDIGSIDLNKICAVPVHLNIAPMMSFLRRKAFTAIILI